MADFNHIKQELNADTATDYIYHLHPTRSKAAVFSPWSNTCVREAACEDPHLLPNVLLLLNPLLSYIIDYPDAQEQSIKFVI